MNANAAVLVVVWALSGPFEGLEHARRPQKPLWDGLSTPQIAAPADGIVALKAPLPTRVRIPGGKFVMGSTPQEMQDAMALCAKEPLGDTCARATNDLHIWSIGNTIRAEGHAHEVTVSDFDLDVTEVTVERYDRCVSAGACSAPGFPRGDARYDQPRFPVTHVAWADADAFCRWVGGRLPTEAEWELAARSRVNNTFPWGMTYNPHLANHGSFPAADRTDARDGFVGLAPVGSFPDGATPSGLLDLAGNAAEWVADFYDRDDQGFSYPLGPQVNPKNTQYSPWGHVIRGGSYLDGAFELRTAYRRALPYASRDVGFRCAADVRPR